MNVNALVGYVAGRLEEVIRFTSLSSDSDLDSDSVRRKLTLIRSTCEELRNEAMKSMRQAETQGL